MPVGPVQLLVIGFDGPDVSRDVLADLERLRDSDVVRIIDLLVVHKDADGVVEPLQNPDLAAGGTAGSGAVVAALIGLAADDDAGGGPLPADEEFWSLDDAIPNDSAAVLALIEHRWAIGLRDTIRAAGGAPLADEWIHPDDLVAAGLTDVDDSAPPDA